MNIVYIPLLIIVLFTLFNMIVEYVILAERSIVPAPQVEYLLENNFDSVLDGTIFTPYGTPFIYIGKYPASLFVKYWVTVEYSDGEEIQGGVIRWTKACKLIDNKIKSVV